jgi:hypothetical protein
LTHAFCFAHRHHFVALLLVKGRIEMQHPTSRRSTRWGALLTVDANRPAADKGRRRTTGLSLAAITVLRRIRTAALFHAWRRRSAVPWRSPGLQQLTITRADALQHPEGTAARLALRTAMLRAFRSFRRWERDGRRRTLRNLTATALSSIASRALQAAAVRQMRTWAAVARYARRQRPALQRLQRVANYYLAQRRFAHWRVFAQRRVAESNAHRQQYDAVRRHASARLRSWLAWLVRRVTHSAADQRLRAIRRDAEGMLAGGAFRALTLFIPIHRSRTAAVATIVQSRQRRAFVLWCRRRHARRHVAEAQLLLRRILQQRLGAAYDGWRIVIQRRMLARSAQRVSLSAIARRYFGAWERHTTDVARPVRQLQLRNEGVLLRRYVTVWRRSMERLVRAVQLEQRHFIVRLQRYYLRWLCASPSYMVPRHTD